MTPGYTCGAGGTVCGRSCLGPSLVVFVVVFETTGGSFLDAFVFLAAGASFLVALPFALDDGSGGVVTTWLLPLESDGVVMGAAPAAAAILADGSVIVRGAKLEALGVAAEDGIGFSVSDFFVGAMEGSIGGDTLEPDGVSKLALLSLFIPSP